MFYYAKFNIQTHTSHSHRSRHPWMHTIDSKSYAHFPGCLKTDLFKISNEGLHHTISNRNGWWMGAAAMEKKRSTIAFIARSVDIHNWPIIIHNMRIIVCPSIDIVALPFSARNNTFLWHISFNVSLIQHLSSTRLLDNNMIYSIFCVLQGVPKTHQ